MKYVTLSKRTFVLATLLALVLMTVQAASAASLKDAAWKIVSSPNGSLPNSDLIGVAAISKQDTWAVGLTYASDFSQVQTLTEHWNGSSWSVVTSPSPAGTFSELVSIAEVSAHDIWAVGDYINAATQVDDTLIEHWNGSQWSIISSPNAGATQNTLNKVIAISQKNVWAVGSFSNDNDTTINTMILHWDGSQWSIVNSPNPSSGTCNLLSGAAATSASDIWAVGVNGLSCASNQQQTLIEHWNGKRWSIVPSPSVGSPPEDLLFGVTAVSDDDVWAMGFGATLNSNNTVQTLIEHWNGKNWSVVPSPNVGSGTNILGSAVALSEDNIWTVGFYTNTSNQRQTLIEHWNGKRWSVVTSPTPPGGGGYLNDIAADSVHDLWAVGQYINTANLRQTLIEHCC